MPYELVIRTDFSAAHSLRGYRGKCERLHGHNWRIELALAGERLGEDGLLLDFAEAKRILQEVIGPLDHVFLNETPPFDRLQPSSENIARSIAEGVAARLPAGVRVACVTTWESDRCAARYKPGD